MAVSAKLYGLFLKDVIDGTAPVNLTTDTIKVALTTVTYTPVQDTDQYFSAVTNEVVGTGYTAGGAVLGTKTITYTALTNVIAFDAADTVWATSSLTARYAVVYKDTGVATTSPLIAYVDFGVDEVSVAANFTITWDTAGVFTVTPAKFAAYLTVLNH